MRKLALLAIVVAVVAFTLGAGRILAVTDLRHADAIVVLVGETDRRPARALELLRQGYAPRVLLDVPRDVYVYNQPVSEIAEQYIHTLPTEVARSVSVCQESGLSTVEEARDVRSCLDAIGARSLLIVTSEYHTRRARSVFRHIYPDRSIGVAGASEPDQFGVLWWRHRQWAKVTVGECARLLWWECVDRWR